MKNLMQVISNLKYSRGFFVVCHIIEQTASETSAKNVQENKGLLRAILVDGMSHSLKRMMGQVNNFNFNSLNHLKKEDQPHTMQAYQANPRFAVQPWHSKQKAPALVAESSATARDQIRVATKKGSTCLPNTPKYKPGTEKIIQHSFIQQNGHAK